MTAWTMRAPADKMSYWVNAVNLESGR